MSARNNQRPSSPATGAASEATSLLISQPGIPCITISAAPASSSASTSDKPSHQQQPFNYQSLSSYSFSSSSSSSENNNNNNNNNSNSNSSSSNNNNLEQGSTLLLSPPVGPLQKLRRLSQHYAPPVERKHTLHKLVVSTSLAFSLIILLMICFTFIKFGAMWNPQQYLHNMNIAICNADMGGIVYNEQQGADRHNLADHGGSSEQINFGSVIAQRIFSLKKDDGETPLFQWEVLPADCAYDIKNRDNDDHHRSGNGLPVLKESVQSEKFWGVIWIPPLFTDNLLRSLGVPTPHDHHPDRDPDVLEKRYHNAILYIFDEGRQHNNHNLARRVLSKRITQMAEVFAIQLLFGRLSEIPFFSQDTPLDLRRVRDLEITACPFVLEGVNLHPVHTNGQGLSVYLSFVILWLGCLFTANVVKLTTLKSEGVYSDLHVVIGRIATSVLFVFFISLTITSCLTVLGAVFEKGFLAFWAYSFLCGVAFLSFIGVFISLLGPLGTMLLSTMLFTQISSSGCFYSPELEPPIFRIGAVLPMYYAVLGARTVQFGSGNRLWKCVGVLSAYAVVCLCVLSVLTYLGVVQRVRALQEERQRRELLDDLLRKRRSSSEKEEGATTTSPTTTGTLIDTRPPSTTTTAPSDTHPLRYLYRNMPLRLTPREEQEERESEHKEEEEDNSRNEAVMNSLASAAYMAPVGEFAFNVMKSPKS